MTSPGGPTTDDSSDLSDRMQELRDELAKLTGQVQTYLADRASDVKDGAVQIAEGTEDLIRENPLPAIGIALGFGLVLGFMVPKRSGRHARHSDFGRRASRDMHRMASSLSDAASNLRHTIEASKSRAQDVVQRASDPALFDRLATLVTGLLESSRSTASSVASAGEKTARKVADTLAGAGR